MLALLVGLAAAVGCTERERLVSQDPGGVALQLFVVAAGEGRREALGEVFDPEDGSLSPTSDLYAPVHEHKATLLASGAVLVSGGMEIEGERRGFVADVGVIEP